MSKNRSDARYLPAGRHGQISETRNINPGYLKLDLQLSGVYIDQSAEKTDDIKHLRSVLAELGFSPELELLLPGSIVVNVSLKKESDTAYRLTSEGSNYFISKGDNKTRVKLINAPGYYSKKSSSGVPLAKIGRLYGEYLIISPTLDCEFLTQNLACCYCDVAARVDKKRTVEEVIETISKAAKDNPIRLICLNTGYLNSPDGGIAVLAPYIKEIKKRFDVLIAVQAQPPLEDEWIDYTYALGVDSLAYNLEVYDPEIFKKIAPGKKKLIGRERYLEAIRRAAKVFPRGAVVSNLIVGLEPIESTMKGISALASMGVIPTLPIARMDSNLKLESLQKLSLDDIAKVHLHLNKTLRKYKLSDTWVSHANIAMNAIDGNHFGGDVPYRGRLENILKSKKGAKLALNLAKMRRNLRVRKVKGS